MQRVFLSMSFVPGDVDLVDAATDFIESQDLLVVTGEDLGGLPLTDEIKRKIDEADALVSICTRREHLAAGSFSTSTWVRDELMYAKAKGKPALALVEDGVDLGGMLAPNEQARFARSDPLKAFAKLANSLAIWRQKAGMTLKAAIVPVDIAVQLRKATTVEYCAVRNGAADNWKSAPLVREIGGLYAYLAGVPRDALVRVRATTDGRVYESVATSLHYYVSLEAEGP
jgi:hypothetical protein